MGGQQKKKISHRARNEIMGFTNSHKPAGLELMQNCDLPPPSKVFMGPDKALMLSMDRVCSIGCKEEQSKNSGSCGIENGDNDGDKMELLKALQASQTRAREAEKKAATLRKERDILSMALMEEAMHLFAFRQQVRFLELQVSNSQSQRQQQQPAMSCCHNDGVPEGALGSSKEDGGNGEERSSVTWVMALVFSLGIGVTTAFACRYLL
ncbi:hypothetical protein TanjilG_11027 [Lupinus angustifolius]|uniref:Uncharacterized protein n=1 Tax=Lupinus angustifolius TaxID=3871 RepID=A0A1J7GAV8_LUPAN|nr:PREDICTED: uncharacterized protein LOC109327818 [Lupinus angustifolius]OIV97503.1 hypothetical protein TanjilG_11027 [Lupinus angustifolius]